MHILLKKLYISFLIIMLCGCTNYEVSNAINHSINLIIDEINIYEKINISSINKDVSGIVIFEEYSMPNEDGLIVIGAHSGSGFNAYFNDLILLEKKDTIEIKYLNKDYWYEIIEVIEVDDTDIEILENNENDLILLSCKLNDDTKRIIVKANKINDIDK